MKRTMDRKFLFRTRKKMNSLFPNRREDEETRQFKSILWGIIGVFILAILLGSLGFWLTLRGSEIIMVPKLEGMTLIDAMEELQSRNLIGHIQTRFFEESPGIVISQRPDAGSQVRIGRTINLTVSRGPIVDQVGNYVGMSLEDLRRQLAAQFATHDPLLEVKNENISYVFSEEPEQTILAQEPSAGQKLAKYADLMLLVSRGPRIIGIEAPATIGLDYRQALGMLAVRNIPFVFRFSEGIESSTEVGIVVNQQPEVGERINEYLELFINPLETGTSNQAAGIFSTILPETALPANVVVRFINSRGETAPYFQTSRLGGEFSFPYIYEIGSQIEISINGELMSESVLQFPDGNSEEEIVDEENTS